MAWGTEMRKSGTMMREHVVEARDIFRSRGIFYIFYIRLVFVRSCIYVKY